MSTSPLYGNNYFVFNLMERVKDLEDKVFKSNREKVTRAQQMLLLKHLGIIELINNIIESKSTKAYLLSIIINQDKDNIEDDLTKINHPDSPIVTKKNYEFLIKTFKALNIKEKEMECQEILDKISK